MKRLIILTAIMFMASTVTASKLSHYIDKVNARDRAAQQQETQQDMNFADFSFRLDSRYVSDDGERCRDYSLRSRTNPFKHGTYTVCDER